MEYVYVKGFLLMKKEVPTTSKCEELPLFPTNLTEEDLKSRYGYVRPENTRGCWTPIQYDRVLLFLIDALKMDFVLPSYLMSGIEEHSGNRTSNPLYYRNKMRAIERTLKTEVLHSKLYGFVSDPPTVTAERIKGLMTGSLPTFKDITDSFDSKQVQVDNVLSQMHETRHLRINFMGDEIWKSIFDKPKSNARQSMFKYFEGFPSLDIFDLHTVDRGCKRHLSKSLEQLVDEWDVLIAHFQGVDHVGHRYQMNHIAMQDKLEEMDDVINDTLTWIRHYHSTHPQEHILLMVFGDHGMTDSGDHGGASDNEVNAGLFVYTTRALTDPLDQRQVQTVPQINLVSTLSLLLGLPIPFSNIGSIIWELFFTAEENLNWMHGLLINALQVNRYLFESRLFHSSTRPDGGEEWMHVQITLQRALDACHVQRMDTQQCIRAFEDFFALVYQQCKLKWTTFHLDWMLAAIAIGLIAFFAIALFTDSYLLYEKQLLLFLSIFTLLFIAANLTEIQIDSTCVYIHIFMYMFMYVHTSIWILMYYVFFLLMANLLLLDAWISSYNGTWMSLIVSVVRVMGCLLALVGYYAHLFAFNTCRDNQNKAAFSLYWLIFALTIAAHGLVAGYWVCVSHGLPDKTTVWWYGCHYCWLGLIGIFVLQCVAVVATIGLHFICKRHKTSNNARAVDINDMIKCFYQVLYSFLPFILVMLGPQSSSLLVSYLLFIVSISKLIACEGSRPNILYVWVSWLFLHLMFFATGHACHFGKLPWKVAFVGGLEYNYHLAAILVFLHYSTGYFLGVLSIPLILLHSLKWRKYDKHDDTQKHPAQRTSLVVEIINQYIMSIVFLNNFLLCVP
ncbi:hypothetical protein RFI_23876 [Reticulomyxa filosa]|uniref:Uncharacterized protein n=1 Tax=Reticulomyxa filosa TaxID=46433 RepID=X6MHK8_RETFI|nr:hypothetical protein RFI_23876 [Reticulomyxa filosa]|eukprot:ETO13493.1 hypothetical protein RFI_23876 [Reticulomyxa filosa]